MRTTIASLALILLFLVPAPAKQPNIIFILADDHRHDALGCLGHPFVKTPHLDRLASEGAIFRNFFVTSALCSPSRASFLTGAYPHNHRAVINDWCDPKLEMYPEMLRKLGYTTAYIGKWHLARHNRPRPGFDYWFSFKGQGSYRKNTFNENGRKIVIERYVTDELNDRALAFIRRQEGDKPFVLCLSHKAIHGPFTPADRHGDLYRDATLAEPATWNDTMRDKPDEIRRLLSRRTEAIGEREAKILWEAGRPVPRMKRGEVAPELKPRPWNGAQESKRDYYRAISAIDDGVGALYGLLERKGMLDNTVIIYTGDNGFGAGEHRRYGGKRLGYEESMRVPFLMRYPGVVPENSEVDELCLNIDLAPTLVEIAGGEPPGSIDGESFLALARGEEVPWRTSFLYEYYQEPWTQRFPTIVGVRTRDWKYLAYPGSDSQAAITDELYALARDPAEETNLTNNPGFGDKKREMITELERLKKEFGYRDYDFAGVYAGRPAPRFWYEDNNHVRPGGMPPDFRRKFEKPDTWARARGVMDAYMIRSNTLLKEENGIEESFLREHMAPVLAAANLPVVIDAGGATHRSAGRKKSALEDDLKLFTMLREAGVRIQSISLQSVLSKPLFDRETRKKLPYPMEKRYRDVVEYYIAVQGRFPDIPIGIVDAMPSHNKDYRTAYRGLGKVLERHGYVLDHVLLDLPFELPETGKNGNSWPKTKKVEEFVREEIGAKFGLICTSKTAGYESDRAYHDAVMEVFERCREHEIHPDYFVMMSWFPHPETSIPDHAPEGSYPALKTFLEAAGRYRD